MMTVLATALLSAANAVAQEYTLREIYQKALNTSEKMEIARENVYVAQMSKDKALSLLIPRLTAYGTYNRFTEDKYNTANIMIQPEDSAAWGVRADQTFSLSARELDALRIAGQSISRVNMIWIGPNRIFFWRSPPLFMTYSKPKKLWILRWPIWKDSPNITIWSKRG